MAVSTGPTPQVFFTLDNSEIMRLSKLRATLKLSHWTKIEGEYELEVSETVEKSIKALELTDPVEFDKRYAKWFNRYTDFTLSWTKSKHPDTHEIIGHLMATGAPRIENLGKIGEGCSVSVMRGPILHQPLPTTAVGDLRINHLQMRIEFKEPWKADGNPSESCTYKVGHQNRLYGDELRGKNKQKFIAAQEAKKDPVTKEFLTDLFTKLGNLALKAAGAEDGNDMDEENKDDKLPGASPSHFSSSKKSYGGNNWSNTGAADPNFHHSFKTSGKQGAIEQVKSFVGPHNNDPTSSGAKEGQPMGGAASLDGHKVVPEGSSDEDNQVRLRLDWGNRNYSVSECKLNSSISCKHWRKTIFSSSLSCHSSAHLTT